jgi:hypothetical protein
VDGNEFQHMRGSNKAGFGKTIHYTFLIRSRQGMADDAFVNVTVLRVGDAAVSLPVSSRPKQRQSMTRTGFETLSRQVRDGVRLT